ncbi:uncharacterized protein LOC126195764 [Schistocerca nitens]|uniref:uncharacterized protein LOC126195764 n=1 Tax=Schistocerca nitens TaxID=7011 RepID=UPI0021188033|nr:uncharacterized protein LOC126195764 [Schistocerca nitens]
MFCLPCGGEAERDDVSEVDPEDEYFIPQNFHILKARLRAKRHEELVAQWEAYFEKIKPVAAAGVRGGQPPAHQDSQLQAAPVEDSQMEGCVSGEVGDATLTQTVAVVHSSPVSSSEEETLPTPRRIRGCRRCWAERLGDKAVVRPHCRQGYRLSRK